MPCGGARPSAGRKPGVVMRGASILIVFTVYEDYTSNL
jgi:hypothetical protein